MTTTTTTTTTTIERVYSFAIHLDSGYEIIVEAPSMSEAVRYAEEPNPHFTGLPQRVSRVAWHTLNQMHIHSTVGFAQRPKYPDGQVAVDLERISKEKEKE